MRHRGSARRTSTSRWPDPDRYQTVYADDAGSVAAPTAGLHLTAGVLERCRAAGADVCGRRPGRRPGHVSALSSGPVDDHVMHTERYRVPAADHATPAERAARVIAIGTTTVRALETAAATGVLGGGPASCSFVPGFLRRGRRPADQLPSAPVDAPVAARGLLWTPVAGLVSGGAGGGYRFLSFGDAMIVGQGTGAA